MSQLPVCVDRVRTAIDRTIPYIEEWDKAAELWEDGHDRQIFRHTIGNSEMSTRYILIDPILRALGWDLSDPKQCVVDYWMEEGRPDYFLFGQDGRLAVIIEAKRIDTDTRDPEHWDQIDDYAKSNMPRLTCVTNGEYWSICRNENGIVQPEAPLALTWDKRNETAERLCHLLGHRT